MYSYSVESSQRQPTITPLTYGSGLNVSGSLANKGFNPDEYKIIGSIESHIAKKNYLRQNLETTINHVFEDSVVSFTNYYQMNNKGDVVSYPDGTVVNIDPEERGGLSQFGIKSAVAGALENPNQVVLLYSPPGPVVFDDNPENKFKEIKPYVDGQLYMMYSDGQKVNNVAISISDEGESWISHLMPHEYLNATSKNSAIDKVKSLITSPLLTGKSIDTFLEEQGSLADRIIFKNKDRVEFSHSQTLALIRQSLAGQLSRSNVVEQVLRHIDVRHITALHIDRIYGALAQQYMKEKGVETLTLGGSCGGTKIELDIFSNGLENLSTSFRKVTQGNNTLNLINSHENKPVITFEHKPGHSCQKCHADGKSNKLGDCDICEQCQKKYDSGEFK